MAISSFRAAVAARRDSSTDSRRVSSEKPDLPRPKSSSQPGAFTGTPACFSGARVLLMESLPEIPAEDLVAACRASVVRSRQFGAKVKEVFPLCENISVDFAVLEKATNVVGLAADDIGWSDVGSWNAVYELLPRDKDGNAVGIRRAVAGCVPAAMWTRPESWSHCLG